MSLGGLQVDGGTGEVLLVGGADACDDLGPAAGAGGSDSSASCRGLYAAGRAACGIASQYYVSGLSLADAVFSGRRAGASIASARAAGKLAAVPAMPAAAAAAAAL